MEGLVCKPEVEMLDRRGKRVMIKVKVKDISEVYSKSLIERLL